MKNKICSKNFLKLYDCIFPGNDLSDSKKIKKTVDFENYLRNTFKDDFHVFEMMIQNIEDINENDPLRFKGYDASLVYHFIQFSNEYDI